MEGEVWRRKQEGVFASYTWIVFLVWREKEGGEVRKKGEPGGDDPASYLSGEGGKGGL